ncbi:hypothetical protein DEAC_c13930 [Desulfosporosinus acididurans]|uniref:PcfJ-like protein n=1 Tax=Desulfosporosinus acididurans TaxID=476652 RepID=A0A0J1FTC4_9FIRM|nr:PcfJ domain-containing protein [Desulfosporosinus acididurans]KLU66725.1 hypothetical protein DEAC_c13930 [Desulfosporosinus acididurans]
MLIAELVIPQMFSSYAEDLDYLKNGLHHFQYFCEECDQVFSSAWGKIPGSMSWYERGNYFTCPSCGHHHQKNVVYLKRSERAPNKIRLSVKEFKKIVTFEVSSKTVYFSDYLHLHEGDHKEVFRFDIAKQRATLVINKDDPIELGNPFKSEIFDSILKFFLPCSLANTNQKKELNNILKVLRTTIQNKLEKHLGYKIPSMYVSPGQFHGTFLLPLLNIAYRSACPDAPNLPVEYREPTQNIEGFWKKKMLTGDTFNTYFMDNVLSLTRQKKNMVTALIIASGLPNLPSVRRSLNEDPFNINILAKSFEICENHDYAMRLFESLRNIGNDTRVRFVLSSDLTNFLKEMKPIYQETGIVRMVENCVEMELWDCINLYQQLNKENREALMAESVRLRELHNWMSLRHKKQTHKNLTFNVPDHIIKRLSMQKERLKFFMPKESMELLEAGHKLHNCVASYGQAMKDNSKWIVLVADDKGKLAACLEIKDNQLVQAKIDRNASVRTDSKLNSEILAWAKESGLKIETQDVKVPDKKKSEKTGLVTIPA